MCVYSTVHALYDRRDCVFSLRISECFDTFIQIRLLKSRSFSNIKILILVLSLAELFNLEN